MRAIDVRALLENPGASRTVRVQEPVPGLRTELADVPEDAPIAADLTLESVVEGIYVRGSLEGRFVLRGLSGGEHTLTASTSEGLIVLEGVTVAVVEGRGARH